MTESDFSLEHYLCSPAGAELGVDMTSERVLNALASFFRPCASPPPVQWRNIRRVCEVLVDEGILLPFSVHLTAELRARAYINDCGTVHFSLGALLTRSSAVTLTVLFHEMAHMWLSQQTFYPMLKRLNREFTAAYSRERAVRLLSPIELYAMTVAIGMMQTVGDSLAWEGMDGKARKRFFRLLSEEREKLALLKYEISMLPRAEAL